MKFLVRRLVWVTVAAGARYVFRRRTAKTVENQRDQLVERLPSPVVALVDRMPVDPIRASSSVIVAGKATKAAASGSQKVTRRAAVGLRSAKNVRNRLTAARDSVRSEFKSEVVDSVRSLRSQYVAITEGEDAATDALLDIRSDASDAGDLPEVPAPVATGRRRWKPALPKPKTNRMQRSYFPPIKPWDRRR